MNLGGNIYEDKKNRRNHTFHSDRASGCRIVYLAGRALYLVGSIVVFAVGMVFLLDPEFVTALFPFIFGVVIMLNGALNIWQAVTLKKEENNWLSHFLLAVLTFGLGIFIFANPFQTIQVLLKAIGVILMFDGISNIWTAAKIG